MPMPLMKAPPEPAGRKTTRIRVPGCGKENLRLTLCAILSSLPGCFGKIQGAPLSLMKISVRESGRSWMFFRQNRIMKKNLPYVFIRKGSYYSDTLSREGKGALVRPDIGLIWSGFRPSDDACTYGYLIPSNMFAVVVLGYLEEIAEKILRDESLRERAGKMKAQVQNAIEIYGRVKTEEFGTVYAYEVDGYGMVNLMDDANVPSLLSMSYLGYPADRETMENTRKMILSEGNPYYYKGKAASGIGSPHTPSGYIWPIALAMEGLTSNSREEKKRILDTLVSTTGGTGMIHEGFSADNPEKYTREWFSWANAMYGELFLDYLGYRLKV